LTGLELAVGRNVIKLSGAPLWGKLLALLPTSKH